MRTLIALIVVTSATTANADIIEFDYTDYTKSPAFLKVLKLARIADGRTLTYQWLDGDFSLFHLDCDEREVTGYFNDETDFDLVFGATWWEWGCWPLQEEGYGRATPDGLTFEIESAGRTRSWTYLGPPKVSTYVPEPSSLALLAIGGLFITGRMRKRTNHGAAT